MLKYLLINRIFTYFNYCQIISILADFGIDHLVMSLCRFVSWVVGKGCCMTNVLSWQNSVSLCPTSFCTPKPNLLLFQVSLKFLLLHSDPLWWKEHLSGVWVLKDLKGLHRTGELQVLQHQWLGYRLRLLWCWIVCLRNRLRSFRHFWSYIQVLHFGLLLTMRAIPFLLRDSRPQ